MREAALSQHGSENFSNNRADATHYDGCQGLETVISSDFSEVPDLSQGTVKVDGAKKLSAHIKRRLLKLQKQAEYKNEVKSIFTFPVSAQITSSPLAPSEYISIPKTIALNPLIPAHVKVIWLYMKTIPPNSEGLRIIKPEIIADRMKLSRATVENYIQHLKNYNLLIRAKRSGYKSAYYLLQPHRFDPKLDQQRYRKDTHSYEPY